MSLVTLERSSPSPHESENEDLLSCSSYEGFVAREHYAMCLSPRPWASLAKHGGREPSRIFAHLKKVVKLLRPPDSLKLVVELENMFPRSRNVTKYLMIITTVGRQDTEETLVLGTEQVDSSVRLCLVLPLWRDTQIKLDGDGGFSVHTGDRHAIFKPSSVQSMWTALQLLYKATDQARVHNYYVGGLSHTWMVYYESQLTDNWAIRNEWNMMEDVESFRPDSPNYVGELTTQENPTTEDRKSTEKLLVHRLREVMLKSDLEEVTSKQLRLSLEEEMKMDLKEYRGFLDQNMLRILGQLERPSQIHDYLYLGSEWNASNLGELKDLGVGYILNITREIDNFYPEVFKYLNIRLYDLPGSELMKHWDRTYQFIKEAKAKGSKVLVHCKMGISRSAATVMAYTMKEYNMSLEDAMVYVKEKRNCVNPNNGFVEQLNAYEGILKARHNELWGKKAPSRHHLGWRRKLNRSFSDPNISQSADLHKLRHYHNDSDDEELPFMPEDDETTSPPNSPWKSTPLRFSTLPLPSSLHVDKSENIRNYLASLPNLLVDVDQGFGGENVCTSESGSGYSSPILTPPEEEQFHTLYRLAKEVQADIRQRLTSDDLESNSPTEDERIADNPPVSGVAGVIPVITTTSISTHSATTTITTQPPPPTVCAAEQPKGAESAERSSKEPSPTPLPVQFTIGPSEGTQPEPCHSFRLIRMGRSTSLPHAGLASVALPSRSPNLSPNSSAVGISSLPRNSSSLQRLIEEAAPSDPPPIDGKVSPLLMERSSPLNQDIQQFDSRSDSPIEVSLPLCERVHLHRRTKSDTCDKSGPVKTAQINSVPERIKEIEERNGQAVGATKAQAQTTQTLEEWPKEAAGSPTGKRSPNPPARRLSASPVRFSSSESLPSDDDELREERSHYQYRVTRHSSLSPNPPSTRSLPPALVAQSSLSLPHNVPPPHMEPDGVSLSNEVKDDEKIAIALQGAVKARVQDFEGMTKEERGSRKSSVENLLRRFSPPNQRRPSTDPAILRPSSNLEMKQLRSSPERSEPVFRKPSQLLHRRPSSDVIVCRRPRSVMADTELSTFESSSGIFMSAEDITSQLGSVQELKRKFEDTQSVDSGERFVPRFKVNLRRAQSLRDFEGLRARRTRRKQVSYPRPGKVSPGRRSSAVTCQPGYVTTIPTCSLPQDVEDFQTTLSKFSMMADGQ